MLKNVQKVDKFFCRYFFDKAHYFLYTPRVTINPKGFLVLEFLVPLMSQNAMTPEVL